MTKRGALTLLGAGLLEGCTKVHAFNVLASRPLSVRVSGHGLAYGPLARQKLDIYRPAGDGPPRPLLVFFYGGGWDEGERADYAFAGRAYASHGFVAVVADYRLTGEAPYPAFLQDAALAVAWAQAHAAAHGADPARTVLAGHSAGAYIAAMLAMDPRWLAQARAPQPVRAWAGLSGPYDFLPFDDPTALKTFGKVADAPSTQPIAYAGPGDPPAFLGYGDKDADVRPRNSQRLAARLKAAGVPVRERAYPGAGHPDTVMALAWPLSLRLPVLKESAGFLHAAVGG